MVLFVISPYVTNEVETMRARIDVPINSGNFSIFPNKKSPSADIPMKIDRDTIGMADRSVLIDEKREIELVGLYEFLVFCHVIEGNSENYGVRFIEDRFLVSKLTGLDRASLAHIFGIEKEYDVRFSSIIAERNLVSGGRFGSKLRSFIADMKKSCRINGQRDDSNSEKEFHDHSRSLTMPESVEFQNGKRCLYFIWAMSFSSCSLCVRGSTS